MLSLFSLCSLYSCDLHLFRMPLNSRFLSIHRRFFKVAVSIAVTYNTANPALVPDKLVLKLPHYKSESVKLVPTDNGRYKMEAQEVFIYGKTNLRRHSRLGINVNSQHVQLELGKLIEERMDDEGYFEAELQLENAQRSKFDVLVIV